MKPGWRSLTVSMVMALGTLAGCGSSGPDERPFTVSEAEVPHECLTGTFIPEEAGFALLQKKPPTDWQLLENVPGAIQAERGAVLVTLRPTGEEEAVTLTDVEFELDNLGVRPVGTVFYKPCKRRLVGAAIEGDLDRFGEIHESNASLDGKLGKGFFIPGDADPVTFPWKVSLKQPLRLFLVVEAYHIWCKWSARISWESGSSHGVIRVDNGGEKYEVVDGLGTGWYRPGPGDKWGAQGTSRWIGVR
jgi:hypothetical protein